MAVGEYLSGLALLSVTLTGVTIATVVLLRRRLSHLAGADRVVAAGLIFTGCVVAAHLAPAALGVLSRGTTVVAALAVGALAFAVPRAAASDPMPAPEPRRASGRLSWLLAALGVAAALTGLLAYVHHQFEFSPTGTDAMNFHLPGVIRWIQEGSIWQIDQFIAYQAHGNYPHHGDVVLLAAVLPWHDDFLLRVVFLPWAALTVVAVYAVARELGAPRPAAALSGALVVTLPNVLFDLVESTLPDAVMFSTFAAGVAFLLRHHRTGARSDLVLAGVGLGLAFGTKWFGVSSVIALLVVWVVASLLERRGWRRVAVDGAVLTGVIGVAGGIWLLRNHILSGNPVFPVKLAPFGVTIFDAPRDVVRELGGFSIANYAGDPEIWREYFVPAWERALGIAAFVLPAATVLSGALAWRRGRRRSLSRLQSDRLLAAVSAAAVLFAVYCVTPYTAFGVKGDPLFTYVNVRYAVPALLVAAAVAASAAGLLGRWGLVVQLAMLAAVADGLSRSADFGPENALRAFAVVALVAAAGFCVSRIARSRPGLGTPAGAVAAACVLLVFAGWAYRQQDRLHDSRYRGKDAVVDYILENASRDRHIGLTGTWSPQGLSPVTPSFGPDLSNHVTYLGPFVNGMLVEHTDRRQFLADLARERYDLVIVGRARAPFPGSPARSGGYDRWLRSAGWKQVTRSRYLNLYRPT